MLLLLLLLLLVIVLIIISITIIAVLVIINCCNYMLLFSLLLLSSLFGTHVFKSEQTIQIQTFYWHLQAGQWNTSSSSFFESKFERTYPQTSAKIKAVTLEGTGIITWVKILSRFFKVWNFLALVPKNIVTLKLGKLDYSLKVEEHVIYSYISSIPKNSSKT